MPIKIVVPEREGFNNATGEFFTYPEETIELEHSLISLQRWEEKWHIPFLTKAIEKTPKQMNDYIRCMVINKISDSALDRLTKDDIDKIQKYIEDSHTATTIKERPGGQRRVITAELIYCWMFSLGINYECRKWHLNQLLTLIEVMSIENDPKAKKNNMMSPRDAAMQSKALNDARRAKMRSGG